MKTPLCKLTYQYSHNDEISIVLAPHGCGAIISIIPDFMSYNAPRLGEVAE